MLPDPQPPPLTQLGSGHSARPGWGCGRADFGCVGSSQIFLLYFHDPFLKHCSLASSPPSLFCVTFSRYESEWIIPIHASLSKIYCKKPWPCFVSHTHRHADTHICFVFSWFLSSRFSEVQESFSSCLVPWLMCFASNVHVAFWSRVLFCWAFLIFLNLFNLSQFFSCQPDLCLIFKTKMMTSCVMRSLSS